MTRMLENIVRGVGTLLDIAPSTTGSTSVGRGIDLDRSDLAALRGDIDRVGGDFRRAFDAETRGVEGHVQSQQEA